MHHDRDTIAIHLSDIKAANFREDQPLTGDKDSVTIFEGISKEAADKLKATISALEDENRRLREEIVAVCDSADNAVRIANEHWMIKRIADALQALHDRVQIARRALGKEG